MKRNFIHLPFNMLFYLILKKNSKNGVLYGLNKEHVNFTAHHDAKFSHGVGQAGSDLCPATGAGQPRQGYRLESLAQHWLGAHAAVHHSHVFAEPSVRSFFYFPNGKK